jgi:hypothetical protein
MPVRPIPIDEESPFLEEKCALCKEPFLLEAEIVVCPEDAARHHVECWQANGSHCTAYGCTGEGLVFRGEELPAGTVVVAGDQSKVRALPSRGLSCARACLWLAIILIVLLCIACAVSLYLIYTLEQSGDILIWSDSLTPFSPFATLNTVT